MVKVQGERGDHVALSTPRMVRKLGFHWDLVGANLVVDKIELIILWAARKVSNGSLPSCSQ